MLINPISQHIYMLINPISHIYICLLTLYHNIYSRPNEPALKCYVERDRSGFNRLHPVYRLYLESTSCATTNSSPPPDSDAKSSSTNKPTQPTPPPCNTTNSRFLAYATKQTASKTSSFLFSCENNTKSNTIDDRGSDYILGKSIIDIV